MTTALRPETPLARFRYWVEHSPDAVCIRYFGTTLTWREVDALSSQIARAWIAEGVEPGARIGLWTQNIPQYVIAMLAAWKCGSAIVPMNPMYKSAEVDALMRDSGARLLVAQSDLLTPDIRSMLDTLPEPVRVYRADPARFATTWPDEVACPPQDCALAIPEIMEITAPDTITLIEPTPSDIAALTYTSGTTGPPKGAMNTHGNIAAATSMYEKVMHLTAADSVICMAPLFHVSGLVGHMGIAFTVGMPMVLAYRFHPKLVARTIEEEQTSYTIASITAFVALMGDDDARAHDMSSLNKPYSGGAPVASAVVERYRALTGAYVHNIYGLTEATGPVLAVPIGEEAPVDASSGALSAGKACPWTDVRIVDADGENVPFGEVGELTCAGPQVVPGYWQKPQESAASFPGGRLHTGDVAICDADGWFYIVDRMKDQINASGFKIWPREVEDALAAHPMIHEVAVVGVPDEYRGETVKAFVTPIGGAYLAPDEVIAFAREHLAAFKVPRIVEIVAELPKTASGKILRRELREHS